MLEIVDIERYQIEEETKNNTVLADVVFFKGILKTDLEMTLGIITYETQPFWSITNYKIGINEELKLFIQLEFKYN